MNDSLQIYSPVFIPDSNLVLFTEIEGYINYNIEKAAFEAAGVRPPIHLAKNGKYIQSIFETHQLAAQNLNVNQKKQITEGSIVITISLIVVYALFALIRQSTGISLNSYLKGIFSFKEYLKFIEERDFGLWAPFPILTIISLWLFTISILNISPNFDWIPLQQQLILPVLFLLILSIYTLKTVSYKILQAISGETMFFNNMGHSFHQSQILMGGFLLIWLILLNSSANLLFDESRRLIVTLLIFGLALFFLFTRSFTFLLIKQKGGYLYFILYFCTVEILPLLYLAKFLHNL